MEGDNIMKRLTSFLVPSFVSNALTPRRGGNGTGLPNQNQGSKSNSEVPQPAYPAPGSGLRVPNEPAPSAASPAVGQPSGEARASTTADTAAGGNEERRRRAARNRGLGGTGTPAALWTSFERGSSSDNGGAGSKRRHVEDDLAPAGSKRPRTLLTSPTSVVSPTAGTASASLFYPGRTAYGGCFSSAAASRSVRATPLLHASASLAAADAAEAASVSASALLQQPQLVTPTAKKILDALDRLSTPLIDARRIPAAAASASFSASGAPPFRAAYRRRMLAGHPPPNRSQQSVGGSGVAAASDTYRSRGFLAPSLRQKQPPPPPQASEFQFSAPIFRGQRAPTRPYGSGLTQPSGSDSWQCTACMVTNQAGSTACAYCTATAAKRRQIDSEAAPPSAAAPVTTSAKASAASSSSSVGASPAEWRCDTCMCTSPASAQACVVCQTARSAPAAPVAAANASTAAAASAEWRCDTCMCTSPVSSQVCVVCQTKRPSAAPASAAAAPSPALSAAPSPAAVAASAEWRCDTCMCTSPVSSQVCIVCQTKRPSVAPAIAFVAASLPKRPSFIDRGPATAPIFSMFSQQQPQQKQQPPKWQCNTCLVENVHSVLRCVACESPKPGAVKPANSAASRNDSTAKISFAVPITSSSDSATKINFGVPTAAPSDSAHKISFGAPAASSCESATKISFGAPAASSSDSAPKISFGAPAASSSDSATKISFGAPAASSSESAPKISFGAPAASSSDSAPKIANVSTPSFAPGVDQAPKRTFVALGSAASNATETRLAFSTAAGAATDSSVAKLAFAAPAASSAAAVQNFKFRAPTTTEGIAAKIPTGLVPPASSSAASGLTLEFGAPKLTPAAANSGEALNKKSASAATGGNAPQFTTKLSSANNGASSSSFAFAPAAPAGAFVFGAAATASAPAAPAAPQFEQSEPTDSKLVRLSSGAQLFNFVGGTNNSNSGVNNGGSGTGLFSGASALLPAGGLFGTAAQLKPADDQPKQLSSGAAFSAASVNPLLPQMNFGQPQSATHSGPFVFGAAQQQQQQQPPPPPPTQMMPQNGPAVGTNPFNPAPQTQTQTTRSRIVAKRRLGTKQ